jgi:lia operon protein LiaF
MALGAYLLLRNLGVIQYNIWEFVGIWWPVILIFVGFKIMFNRSHMKHKFHKNYKCGDFKNVDYDVNKKGELFISKSFGSFSVDLSGKIIKKGAINFSMGEFIVDLDNIKLSSGSGQLDIITKMGGTKIKLDPKLPVSIKADNTMGEVVVFGKRSSGFSGVVGYESPAYNKSKSKLNIYIKNALGETIVSE